MTLHLANHRKGFPQGMTWVTKVDDPDDNTGIAFGVYRMKAGETAEQVAEGETAWLLMTGSAAISVGNVTKEWQRDRMDQQCDIEDQREAEWDTEKPGCNAPNGLRRRALSTSRPGRE